MWMIEMTACKTMNQGLLSSLRLRDKVEKVKKWKKQLREAFYYFISSDDYSSIVKTGLLSFYAACNA